MATAKLRMSAIGTEKCHGCGHPMARGETMSAIEYADGEPAGWHCEACMNVYRELARFDPEEAKRRRQLPEVQS